MQKWCKKGVVKGLRERERLKIRGSRNTLAKVYHSKSCWLNAFAANLSFKNKYGSDACSMKRLVIKIIQSPEHIKIDARCYFTSKCKISPRVIYFMCSVSEQAE